MPGTVVDYVNLSYYIGKTSPTSIPGNASLCIQVVQKAIWSLRRSLVFDDSTTQHNTPIRCRNHEKDYNISISIDPGNALPRMFSPENPTTQTSGPALITSSVASSLYFLKFSTKRPPNFVTSSLKSALPVQLFLGLSNSSGTPGQVFGTLRLKVS